MRAALALILLLAACSDALASIWAGEGWYVVAQSPFGDTLVSGPFADDTACDKARTGQADYTCVLYSKQPDWDR